MLHYEAAQKMVFSGYIGNCDKTVKYVLNICQKEIDFNRKIVRISRISAVWPEAAAARDHYHHLFSCRPVTGSDDFGGPDQILLVISGGQAIPEQTLMGRNGRGDAANQEERPQKDHGDGENFEHKKTRPKSAGFVFSQVSELYF